MPRFIEFHEVETKIDATKYLSETCSAKGLEATIYAFYIGCGGLYLLSLKWYRRVPTFYEYKLAASATSMIIGSYFVGKYVKVKCEEEVREKLDHLLR